MIENVKLRSRFGKIISLILWALIAFSIVNVLLQPNRTELLGLCCFLLSFAVLIYGIYWHPKIEFTSGYIRVVNLMSDWRVSYGTITHMSTQFTLAIHTTDGRKISVWSAPAPSRYGMMSVSKQETEHLPTSTYEGELIRPGDIVTSDSGSAAAIARRNWETYNRNGSSTSEGISVSYSFLWPAIAVVLAGIGLLLS